MRSRVGCTRLQGTARLLLLWNRGTICSSRPRFGHDGRIRVSPVCRSALLPSRPLPRKRWSAVMTCCSRQRASFSNRGATGSEARFGSATRSRYARRVGTTVSDVDANLGKAGRPGFRSPVTPFLTPLLPIAPCDFFRFGVDAPRLGVSNPDADENCACAPIASLVCTAQTVMEDRRLPRAFVSRSRSR